MKLYIYIGLKYESLQRITERNKTSEAQNSNVMLFSRWFKKNHIKTSKFPNKRVFSA